MFFISANISDYNFNILKAPNAVHCSKYIKVFLKKKRKNAEDIRKKHHQTWPEHSLYSTFYKNDEHGQKGVKKN